MGCSLSSLRILMRTSVASVFCNWPRTKATSCFSKADLDCSRHLAMRSTACFPPLFLTAKIASYLSCILALSSKARASSFSASVFWTSSETSVGSTVLNTLSPPSAFSSTFLFCSSTILLNANSHVSATSLDASSRCSSSTCFICGIPIAPRASAASCLTMTSSSVSLNTFLNPSTTSSFPSRICPKTYATSCLNRAPCFFSINARSRGSLVNALGFTFIKANKHLYRLANTSSSSSNRFPNAINLSPFATRWSKT
mmetsp:Transcript_12006/g.33234  ORF Transcript_12006/g.33234 Transcript_12006/m.33234 type:complete len:256 (+) Transcript_12006:280-1047(+)